MPKKPRFKRGISPGGRAYTIEQNYGRRTVQMSRGRGGSEPSYEKSYYEQNP